MSLLARMKTDHLKLGPRSLQVKQSFRFVLVASTRDCTSGLSPRSGGGRDWRWLRTRSRLRDQAAARCLEPRLQFVFELSSRQTRRDRIEDLHDDSAREPGE